MISAVELILLLMNRLGICGSIIPGTHVEVHMFADRFPDIGEDVLIALDKTRTSKFEHHISGNTLDRCFGDLFIGPIDTSSIESSDRDRT